MNKFIFILIIVLLIIFFIYLMKQSKKPTGYIGKKMIGIWNNSYVSLYINSIRLLNINKDANLKIVDLGIGSGLSTNYLATYFKNSNVLGIDYSSLAVQEARKNNAKLIETNRVSIIIGDVEELLLNKESYDLVCAFQTHFHWNNFEKCLDNIFGILKKDGILLISCEANKPKYHLKKYCTYSQLSVLIKELGFSDIKEIKDGSNIIYIIKK